MSVEQKPALAVLPAAAPDKKPPSVKRSKYGTKPLAFSLPEAILVVRQLLNEAGPDAALPKHLIAVAIGNTVTSSSFARKVASLRSFGLLDESTGSFRVSKLGIEAAFPVDPQAGQEAKMRALLSVDPFRAIFEKNKGRTVPPVEFLRNLIEQECSVPKQWSAEWVDHFQKGAREAGLIHPLADGRILISDSSSGKVASSEQKPAVSATPKEQPPSPSATESPSVGDKVADGGGHNSILPLSGGKIAVFQIPGDLSAKDAKRIGRFLEGLKVMIDSLVSDAEEASD
jgi:hypothetical protein